MRTREEADKRRAAKCRHFTGTMNRLCTSKIEYPKDEVCWGENYCDGYSPLTIEELKDKDVEMQRHMELMRQGLSSCCEAPFDTSQVITEGRHKNHGPRFCSKCKRLCFMV